MAADWSVLLTSDFAGDVVAGASLVGPAGTMPIGLESGVTVVVELGTGFVKGAATGAGTKYELSLHPVVNSVKAKAASIAMAKGVLRSVFMVG